MKVESPSKSTRLRLSIIVVILLMVISSPIVMLANPALIAAPLSGPSTIGQDGSDFTTQATLSSLTARPTNNIVNTNSFYDVVFLAASSGAIKTIEVTFPAGTTIPAGAYFNEAEKCVPGGDCTEMTGTVSKSGQTITYTVTNAVNIPAGTKVRLEFANINSPLNPGAYIVTVTTRDAANAIIDGPTQSTAYTMKQIGANDIADNSITSTKPNEGFMKRVTLLDNNAGNALGWDPNGAITTFTITEPAVGGIDSTYVGTNIKFGGSVVCNVTDTVMFSSFSLACITAPPNFAELHYVVENLPAHLF